MVALLDSVMVAGFLDRDDAFHPAADGRIRELAGRHSLVVSVITYADVLTGAGRGHHAQDAVRGFFRDLVDDVHGVDRAIAERAAALRSTKRSLRMPDALILATAEVRNADCVITGDRSWTNVDIGPAIELLRPTGG